MGTGPKSAKAFAGRWTLSRVIRHADGLEGRFDGWVDIRPAGPGRYSYDEDGTLRLGEGEPLRGTRRYIWREAGEGVNVYFPDGRPFHRIDLSGPRTATVHMCEPDRYAVAYEFSDWPQWSTRWQVEGPRKAYAMISRLTKAD